MSDFPLLSGQGMSPVVRLPLLWGRCLWGELLSLRDKFLILSLLHAEIKRRDKLKYQKKRQF